MSKEQNMIVTRPFSYTCEMVSDPDPVASTYAAWLGPKMEKELEGRPLGDMFMCLLASGAEAVKKMDCF